MSNSLTFTINVTNLTGYNLEDVVVTNVLPDSVELQSVSYSQGSYTTTNSIVAFDLGVFYYGEVAQLIVTAEPTVTGNITNAVTVNSAYVTNTASASTVVDVTSVAPVETDLGVTMIGPRQAVITNDWMAYEVAVTNFGPGSATNVILTNTLPSDVGLIGISPANLSYTFANSNVVLDLGVIADGGYTSVQFTVQPTNAGVQTFSVSVGSADVSDIYTDNNFASTNITVITYLSGQLVAVTNSGQSLNLQDGLTEQSILLSNSDVKTTVPAARVVITGLTNQLFNAAGTNNGKPFVYYSDPLAPGQSVSLLLQYNPRGSFQFTNGQLHAFAVPLPDWTPPEATTTSTNINITRIVRLANGNMLIEFPSTLGRSYTVVYSDNVLFSNAEIAPPSIVAPANRVQWIDYGPPTTVSAPTKTSTRFYRVFANP